MSKKEMALFDSSVPEWFNPESNMGSENVQAEDLEIPRLEICQALSPCLDKTAPEYIEGITPGQLYNSVSGKNYGDGVYVVPISFKKQWLIWRDRKSGGGFGGAFNTLEEAEKELVALKAEDPRDTIYDINDTGLHFCLLISQSGGHIHTEQIVISMSKSKMKISRKWNSLIQMAGGDRFSRVYQITTVMDANRDGDKYHNLKVEMVGFAPEAAYKAGLEAYKVVGQDFKVAEDESQE